MNILILASGGGVAGSTYSISYLANGLAKLGNKVFLGLNENTLMDQLVDPALVQKIYLPFRKKFDLQTAQILKDLIEKENIELINAQSSKARYLGPLINLRYRKRIPIVQTRRQTPLEVNNLNIKAQTFFNNAFSDYLITVSEELKRIFVDRGVKANKIKVIYNGTPSEQYQQDLEKQQELRKKLKLSENDIVIGCISRLKNQFEIVEALQFLPENWKVIFVGFTEEEYYKKYPEHYRIDQLKQQVYCLGSVQDKKEVLQYYPLMDLNILASTTDGFGLTLVESMAMGTPVIGTNYAGIKDVIDHEENGLLYNFKDINGLVQQIKRLIEDKELRSKLIENGKKTAFEKYAVENTIKNHHDFFLKVINNKVGKL